jgi:hypothetical protein
MAGLASMTSAITSRLASGIASWPAPRSSPEDPAAAGGLRQRVHGLLQDEPRPVNAVLDRGVPVALLAWQHSPSGYPLSPPQSPSLEPASRRQHPASFVVWLHDQMRSVDGGR